MPGWRAIGQHPPRTGRERRAAHCLAPRPAADRGTAAHQSEPTSPGSANDSGNPPPDRRRRSARTRLYQNPAPPHPVLGDRRSGGGQIQTGSIGQGSGDRGWPHPQCSPHGPIAGQMADLPNLGAPVIRGKDRPLDLVRPDVVIHFAAGCAVKHCNRNTRQPNAVSNQGGRTGQSERRAAKCDHTIEHKSRLKDYVFWKAQNSRILSFYALLMSTRSGSKIETRTSPTSLL